MRSLASFALGALLGLIGCVAVLYLSGILFDYLGIRLYESEYDQQRNFNVFVLVSVVVAGVSGLVSLKMYQNRMAPKDPSAAVGRMDD